VIDFSGKDWGLWRRIEGACKALFEMLSPRVAEGAGGCCCQRQSWAIYLVHAFALDMLQHCKISAILQIIWYT